MLLKKIVRAAKQNVTVTGWSQDKPQRRVFPLSGRAGGCFPITRKWRWSVVEFDALSAHFRLMVAYHTEVPAFQMVLGEALRGDTRVLCRVEFDVAHARFGWHVHSYCDESSGAKPGLMKPLGVKRVPSANSLHRRSSYVLNGDSMNDIIALDVAAKWFRFTYQGSFGFH